MRYLALAALLAVTSPALAASPTGTPSFLTLGVGGTGPITGFGTGQFKALAPLILRGGIPSIELGNQLIWNRATATNNDGTDTFFRRDGSAVTGGSGASINKTVTIIQSVGAADASSNWGFLSSLTSSNTVGAQSLCCYFQSVRAAGSNAWMWGTVTEMTDQTGSASSVIGNPTLSQEIDLSTTGADDYVNPSKFGGVGGRHMAHYVATRFTGSANNEVTTGLWFGTTNTFIDSLIGFDLGVGAAGAQVRQVLDTRGAIPPTGVTDPVAAVRMSAGQIIDFNGGAALNSAAGDYMAWDGATSKLKYYHAGVAKWSVDASGNGRFAGTVTGSVTP